MSIALTDNRNECAVCGFLSKNYVAFECTESANTEFICLSCINDISVWIDKINGDNE